MASQMPGDQEIPTLIQVSPIKIALYIKCFRRTRIS